MPHVDLPEPYRKARRNYGFAAGLLLTWELIGVRIYQVESAGVKLELLTPEAARFAIVLLVLYFGGRYQLESRMADSNVIKGSKAARVDFLVAHLIGLVSLFVFGFQFIQGSQIASPSPSDLLGGVVSGLCVALAYATFRSPELSLPRSLLYGLTGLLTGLLSSGFVALASPILGPILVISYAVTYTVSWGAVEYVYWNLKQKPLSSTPVNQRAPSDSPPEPLV